MGYLEEIAGELIASPLQPPDPKRRVYTVTTRSVRLVCEARSAAAQIRDFTAAAAEIRRTITRWDVEQFVALYLDSKNRVIRAEIVSSGTLGASLVHPRELYAPAIEARAAALIVGHNHPSGDPAPSPEDRTVTQRLRDAGELLGIAMLDHVIVTADGPVYSFACDAADA